MKGKRKPVLLVDGDEFLFKATTAVEQEVRWDEDHHVLYSSFSEAWKNFQSLISDIQERLEVEEMRIAFTKGESFRKGIFPDYKGNRTNTRKPLCYWRVREAAEEKYTTYSYEGLEADDILGIWATRGGNIDPIIVSQDKDLKTIPGKLYQKGELRTITPAQADYHWLYQTLTGDQVDGFPGCPGIGPKTAEKILTKATEQNTVSPEELLLIRWDLVLNAYEKAGLSAEDALQQARLARILRSTDWNADKKEVILWTPDPKA